MNGRMVLPFGFLSEHVVRECGHRNLLVLDDCGAKGSRVIAIGTPAPDDGHGPEHLLAGVLADLDQVILFGGFRFDRMARARSLNLLRNMLQTHGIPLHVLEEEEVESSVGAGWREMSMSRVFNKVSAMLLDAIAAA
ncbi:MAG: hypothetical protein JSS44_12995 [Proteobacteria bacterium]|nr:hypothetical protein [Pseudomonadota bacterium]